MPKSYVRFIAPAVADAQGLARKDPQVVRQLLKKCLLLERDCQAGEPLLGGLVGFRKIVVGNRDWRIVWRCTTDEAGASVVDVAEVWAAGARADAEVYREVTSRLDDVTDETQRVALGEVVRLLAPELGDIAAKEPETDPVPDWLSERLVRTAGVDSRRLVGMTGRAAMELWDAYQRGEDVSG